MLVIRRKVGQAIRLSRDGREFVVRLVESDPDHASVAVSSDEDESACGVFRMQRGHQLRLGNGEGSVLQLLSSGPAAARIGLNAVGWEVTREP